MHRIWGFVSLLTGGRVYVRHPEDAGGIHLTFDDGPHPVHTPRLLGLLARHNVRATFFVLGERAVQHEEIVRQITAGGHALGNHSYTHPSFSSIPLSRQASEIERTEALLSRFDGKRVHPFRPPRGHLTSTTIALCLWRKYPLALWTHDSLDYKLEADQVVALLGEKRLRPGDILLFHDDTAVGLAALEELLPIWLGAGIKFSTLGDYA